MRGRPERGILSGPVDGPWRERPAYTAVPAVTGLVVEHLASGFVGTVAGFESGALVVRPGSGGPDRLFALREGAFSVGGKRVTLVTPQAGGPGGRPARTASGSVDPGRTRARTARAGRILVEGLHDAELVEKVWGDDLRVEGVVVEMLEGVDHLPGFVSSFAPGPGARLGVLVDHLVAGSKESRIAKSCEGPHVAIRGTPFVDVWQAIRPGVAGLGSWPVVERGTAWKKGICDAFGEPDPGRLWRRLLGRVRSYADLEPELVGAVESLIDFVTKPGPPPI